MFKILVLTLFLAFVLKRFGRRLTNQQILLILALFALTLHFLNRMGTINLESFISKASNGNGTIGGGCGSNCQCGCQEGGECHCQTGGGCGCLQTYPVNPCWKTLPRYWAGKLLPNFTKTVQITPTIPVLLPDKKPVRKLPYPECSSDLECDYPLKCCGGKCKPRSMVDLLRGDNLYVPQRMAICPTCPPKPAPAFEGTFEDIQGGNPCC